MSKTSKQFTEILLRAFGEGTKEIQAITMPGPSNEEKITQAIALAVALGGIPVRIGKELLS